MRRCGVAERSTTRRVQGTRCNGTQDPSARVYAHVRQLDLPDGGVGRVCGLVTKLAWGIDVLVEVVFCRASRSCVRNRRRIRFLQERL
jgi:hypothetical protein